MADPDRIKRNLSKMIDQGAPEGDLDGYLKTEGFNSADEWRASIAPKPEARTPVVASAVYGGRPMSLPAETPGPGAAPQQPQPTNEPPALPWADLPGNIPKSGGNFLSAMVHPFIHPVDTAEALGKVGLGVVSKGRALAQNVMGVPNDVNRAEVEAPADAMGNYFSDRAGSLRKVRNTVISDPVGAAADFSLLLGAGGATLPGRVGAVAGKAATMLDPVAQTGNAFKLAGKGAEAATSTGLGMTTGAGTESVRAAARAGKQGGESAGAFQSAIRGNTSIEDTVATARSAVDQVRKERSDAYKAGMSDVAKDTAVMDFAPIDAAVDKAAQVGSFKGVTVEPKAQGIVTDMRKTVEDWKKLDPAEYHTPEGIDALKRTLGNIRDSTLPGTPERVAADRVYSAVRGELAAQAPEYAKIMEAYGQASDKLKEVTKTLSLGEKATGDTAGRKLLSATRNNAQTNYGQRVKLIEQLAEHEPTLPYEIAGHGLNALAPQGVVGRGGLMGSVIANPANAFAAPAFSPRVVGEAAYYAGKGAGLGENALALLRINERNLRRGGRAGYQAGRQQEAQ